MATVGLAPKRDINQTLLIFEKKLYLILVEEQYKI
jgi:hypothetical protein